MPARHELTLATKDSGTRNCIRCSQRSSPSSKTEHNAVPGVGPPCADATEACVPHARLHIKAVILIAPPARQVKTLSGCRIPAAHIESASTACDIHAGLLDCWGLSQKTHGSVDFISTKSAGGRFWMTGDLRVMDTATCQRRW